jgi:hypothetical protein
LALAVIALESVEHFALARARRDDVESALDLVECVVKVLKPGLNEIPLNAGPQQERQAWVNGVIVVQAGEGGIFAHGRTQRGEASGRRKRSG